MLSIGKIGMSRGQQLYYEEQVAKGREDYYAGKGEAPGRWTGSGGRLLGLRGELDVEQLKALMDGRHPGTGEQLAQRTGNASTAAIDMTFSAPKSVSVLFAVADEQLSTVLVEAHEAAVDAALAYVEGEACKVRRGHNGTKAERERNDPRGWERARSEQAGGFVAGAYRHRMSRAQDPQLHTHVVAANMARGADGRWTALDARHIYEHAKAAGALYQAHLRAGVRERVGWAQWGGVRNGMAEIEQVPAGVREEFSTRRHRILERERELEAAGTTIGDAGRARIAYGTRERKEEIDDRDWRSEIRARAAEHGLGQTELDELAQLPDTPQAAPAGDRALADQLFSPGGVTAATNTFQRRDVVIAVASAHGQGASAEQILAITERMLADPRAVEIPAATDGRYTTQELLDAESKIVEHATAGQGQRAGVLDEGRIDRTLQQLPLPLTDEQADAVTAIATSGNRIETVEALAGTGKTTSAAALRVLYERQGYRVIGAAPTGRAVRELAERAGIAEARTLDGWAVKLGASPHALSFAEVDEVGRVRRVPAVMIIDEAGMAQTRLSATVIDAAVAARVKVIAIGDSGQLSSVQAGGWLGALTRQLGSHELREVMRQHDPLERRGLARLHRGQPDEYVQLKVGRGELELFTGEQPGVDAERAAIAQWAGARDRHGAEQAVLITRDNARRERLNQAAREHLAARGVLGEQIEIAGQEWAVGDRVIARRNDRGRDLDNGMRGTITAVDEQHGLTVRIDAGERRQLDCEYAAEHLEHAYALTGHGMQGGTVQWAGVIGQAEDFTRNWSYTALSRARQPTRILLIDGPTRSQQEREQIAPATLDRSAGPVDRLAARMLQRDDEDLALEQLQHAQPNEPEPELQPRAETAPGVGRAPIDTDQATAAETSATITPTRAEPDLVQAAPAGALAELGAVRAELAELRDRLNDPVVQAARELVSARETSAAVRAEANRDRKPGGWRDRSAHQLRAAVRERELAELADRERQLLDRVADPETVLEQARGDRERQGTLIRLDRELNRQAVAEELERNPPWLQATLGPEPDRDDHRARWQRTARELASNRIDRHITSPTDPGIRPGDHALTRSVTDTRAALGLDVPALGRDQGRELD